MTHHYEQECKTTSKTPIAQLQNSQFLKSLSQVDLAGNDSWY